MCTPPATRGLKAFETRLCLTNEAVRKLVGLVVLSALCESGCLHVGGTGPNVGPSPEEVSPPTSALVLFGALPETALHERVRDRTAVLSARRENAEQALRDELSYWAKVDVNSGSLLVASIGDGGGWQEAFRVFALPGGGTVLLSVSSDWGMCGEQSRVRVWQVGEQGVVDATAERWSRPTWTHFNRGVPVEEKHKRLPEYAVTFDGEGSVSLALDGCQFEYPGELGPLEFEHARAVFESRLPVTWTNGRFVIQDSIRLEAD